MVNYYQGSLDFTFAALADPTRRAIVQRLASRSATVKELAKPFKISLPAISKHLRILQEAGLLSRQKEGRLHHCHLNAMPLEEAQDWFTVHQQFWNQQLDALEKFLSQGAKSLHTKETTPWPTRPKSATRLSTSREPTKRVAKKSGTRGQARTR